MLTDPIADMLNRISNASRARQEKVTMPASRFRVRLAEILRDEGYIAGVSVSDGLPHRTLQIALKYERGGSPVIQGLRRVSRPGMRIYRRASGIPKILNGLGLAVLSTSRGLLPDRTARQHGVGGEHVLSVW